MKALRHKLGRWLLRDADRRLHLTLVVDDDAESIHAALLKLRRRKGGRGLGLS